MDPAEITLFLSETLGGQYRPVRHLASGGFAGTFEATDQHSGRQVAAKVLQLQHCAAMDAVREFQDEAAMLDRLKHCDRVVDLLASGKHTVHLRHASGGVIPITTEFAILELAAGSLADLLLLGSSLEWADRLGLYRDVVKGVHQMHLNRIVHRDIKSENALIIDKPLVAKVADLGRARDTSQPPRITPDQYLHGRGDARFAPLECLWLQSSDDPEAHARADLYLLGSLLFEIAVGVGITSLIVSDPIALIYRNAALSPSDRIQSWLAAVPQLKDAARPVYETFSFAVPRAARRSMTDVLMTLTDPEPVKRLPTKSRGAAPPPGLWDLQWLLERVDAIRRAVDPALRKAYLASRPNRTHRHARPGHRR